MHVPQLKKCTLGDFPILGECFKQTADRIYGCKYKHFSFSVITVLQKGIKGVKSN